VLILQQNKTKRQKEKLSTKWSFVDWVFLCLLNNCFGSLDNILFTELLNSVLLETSFSPSSGWKFVGLSFLEMYLAIWQKGLFDRDKIRFPHRQTKEKKHVTSPERFKLEKYKKTDRIAFENANRKSPKNLSWLVKFWYEIFLIR